MTGRRPTAAQRYAPRAAWRPWPPCTTLFPRALMCACGSVRLEATREKGESRDAVAMVAGESGGTLPDLRPSRFHGCVCTRGHGPLSHTPARHATTTSIHTGNNREGSARETREPHTEAPPNAQGAWALSSHVHDTHNSQAHDTTSHPHPTPMSAPQIGRPTGRHPAARALSREGPARALSRMQPPPSASSAARRPA